MGTAGRESEEQNKADNEKVWRGVVKSTGGNSNA